MKAYCDLFYRKALDYIFFRPSLGATLIKCGVTVLLALLAGFSLTVIFPVQRGDILVALNASNDAAALLFQIALPIALLLIAGGAGLIIRDIRRDNRKKVIAVELLGLRDINPHSLASAVPRKIAGRRENLVIDIRQGADGKLIDPDVALGRVLSLPHLLSASTQGREHDDVQIVAAGLAAVPFAFLLGVLLDDESRVELMDWDRKAQMWRSLDGIDDGARFAIDGLQTVGDAREAVVAISFSYPVDRAAIAETFPGLPVVDLALPHHSIDGHWSAEKQIALADQFFELARTLSGTSVRTLHLVCAAPASLAIRFGRIYDKRNLPSLIVYQYEQKATPPYPWGVSMPLAGSSAALERR
jgi:hypothetical protein